MPRRTNAEQAAAREDDVMAALPMLPYLTYEAGAAPNTGDLKLVAQTLNAAGFDLVFRFNPDTGDMQAYALPSFVGKAERLFSRHIYHGDGDVDE